MRAVMKKFVIHKELFKRDTEDIILDLPDPLKELTIPGRVKEGEIIIPK
jgi:hypothetical protein